MFFNHFTLTGEAKQRTINLFYRALSNLTCRDAHPVAKTLPDKPKLALSGRLACQPKPRNANLNLPNRGVQTVDRNPPKEQKLDLWDALPVSRNPEMETQNLLKRDVQLVTRNPEMEANLWTRTQHHHVLMSA